MLDGDEHVLEPRAARMVRVDVAGRDRAHLERLGQVAEGGVAAGVPADVRTLQLDIEAVAEHPGHLGQRRLAVRRLAGGEQRIDRAVAPARKQQQPLGVLDHRPLEVGPAEVEAQVAGRGRVGHLRTRR